jgi:two-component system cell cycle response regulator
MNRRMDKKLFTILNVDNDPKQLSLNSSVLKGHGYAILEATTGTKCLQLARIEKPDAILLAAQLPDIDPTEVCRRLKADIETSRILVILISPLEPANGMQGASVESDATDPRPSPESGGLARTTGKRPNGGTRDHQCGLTERDCRAQADGGEDQDK